MQLSCLLLVIIIWSVFKKDEGVSVDCVEDSDREAAQLFLSCAAHLCGCVHMYIYNVLARVCNKNGS